MKLSNYESFNFLLDYSSEATLENSSKTFQPKLNSHHETRLYKTKQKHPEVFCLSSRHWHLITESNRLGQIYSERAIVAYTKDEYL